MINVPMKSTVPVTKQTVININSIRIQSPKSSRDILSLNSQKTDTHSVMESTKVHSAIETSNSSPKTENHNTIFIQTIPSLTNSIKKGQKVAIENQTKLKMIQAKLGWNVLNQACDVDVSAFLLNDTGKVIGDSWFVFYGQKSSPDGSTTFSIVHNQDREIIQIDFTKLSSSVSKIVFVLTINEALEKNLNFSMLKDAYIRIMDSTNTEIVSFKMEEYYSNVTSMMIGELYLHNGIWKFNAIGNGVARDLAGLCELYGVQVI